MATRREIFLDPSFNKKIPNSIETSIFIAIIVRSISMMNFLDPKVQYLIRAYKFASTVYHFTIPTIRHLSMDTLPESLLFDILNRLDDSADVTRCRLTSKAFDSVYPDLRSINLQCTLKWYFNSGSRVRSSQVLAPFKSVFINMIKELREVESVCIGVDKALEDAVQGETDNENVDLHLTDDAFINQWLPRVSRSLNSLCICSFGAQSVRHRSNLLPIVSAYCHTTLVKLWVKNAWLSMNNLNAMPFVTSLTLENIRIDDKHVDQLNNCFPNLQVLNLINISGVKFPHIAFPNLQTCHLVVSVVTMVAIVTPNLVRLKLECSSTTMLYVKAPMMTHFHLALNHFETTHIIMYESLKTLVLESLNIDLILSRFPRNCVENLTLDSGNIAGGAIRNSKFNLINVFSNFGYTRSLCITSSGLSQLEPSYNAENSFDQRNGLNIFKAYVSLVDPAAAFSDVATVLYECRCLSEVSLLIHSDTVGHVSKNFIARCTTRWPEVKWNWGTWTEGLDDSWITDSLETNI